MSKSDIEKDLYIAELEDQIISLIASKYQDDPVISSEDKEEGTCNVQFKHTLEALTDEQIYQECKRSPQVWKLVQVWKKKRSNGFIYSANFKLLESDPEQCFQNRFMSFLSTLELTLPETSGPDYDDDKTNALLVLNKQDFHFNKYDIQGNNNVQQRLDNVEAVTRKLAAKAARNYNLEKIVYIIGSDCFNSEWTNATTKGTPQENILSYHQSFEAIVTHEISVIKSLLERGNQLEVIYVPGNHDNYVGWHLIKMLETAFSAEGRITFSTSQFHRKYLRYSNTAVLFNHGAEVKPQQLANIFPVEFKTEWSLTDHWYIFTGDKHVPIQRSFAGIEFYGIPALDKARSNWEDLKGFGGDKSTYTAFIIEENNGMADIYKEYL